MTCVHVISLPVLHPPIISCKCVWCPDQNQHLSSTACLIYKSNLNWPFYLYGYSHASEGLIKAYKVHVNIKSRTIKISLLYSIWWQGQDVIPKHPTLTPTEPAEINWWPGQMMWYIALGQMMIYIALNENVTMRNTKALQPCRNLRQCKGPIDGEMDVMLNSKQANQINH